MSPKIDEIISGVVDLSGGKAEILNKAKLAESVIDKLVWESVFGVEGDKNTSRFLIWEIAQALGIYSSSINDLYKARGREETPLDFTVPAINIRGMAYDFSRAIFSTAKKTNTGALILELARSEMGYTDQTPWEVTAVVLAAAIKEGWSGPVFIQGDHYQAKSEVPGIPKEGDIDEIKKLIEASIKAGFYNIDIDMSTLVDLSKATEDEQQRSNIEYSLELATLVRSLQPASYVISLGCEIGHIGGQNSTVEDLRAFMKGLTSNSNYKLLSPSKIAIQTGTSHGGVVQADGTLAKVAVDFPLLSKVSQVARHEYGIGGAVQHGASTLPPDMFNHFPENQTLEIHLATEFQNMIMNHPMFPVDLLKVMYEWLDKEQLKEKEEGQTDEQFHYKARKKAWGKFKKECWQIDDLVRAEIRNTLSEKLEFLFKELNVINTKDLVNKFIKPHESHRSPTDYGVDDFKAGNVSNLSD